MRPRCSFRGIWSTYLRRSYPWCHEPRYPFARLASFKANSSQRLRCHDFDSIVFFVLDAARTTIFNPIVRFFVIPPFVETGSFFQLAPALGIAVLAILLIVFLARLELQLGERSANYLPTTCQVGLLITVGLTCFCFFDFSLPSDALHYLTNVAPALHLQFGGVLMVDTFSQYGPGPVLMTLLGLTLGPTKLATANIVVQIHNLAFYSLWIFCLYRLSTLKLPALVIGFLSIGALMAVWGGETSNINFAPSILGFRYLPILLMVVAIP